MCVNGVVIYIYCIIIYNIIYIYIYIYIIIYIYIYRQQFHYTEIHAVHDIICI